MSSSIAERAIAAQTLRNASMHLLELPYRQTMAARDVLHDAERRVKNGFSTPNHAYWNGCIDTVFSIWPESKG